MATTIPPDFGHGGKGLTPGSSTPTLATLLASLDTDIETNLATLNALYAYRDSGGVGVTAIDFSGVPTNDETIVIGTETWTKKATESAAFEFDGASANACAISLGAAIGDDTAQAITAVVVTDSIFVFYNSPGTAGNLVVTNNLTNATAGSLRGGTAAGEKKMIAVRRAPDDSEVACGEVHIPLPFVPRAWDLTVYVTATGVEKADATDAEIFDGPITIGTSPDRLIIGQGTNLLWATTDTLNLIVWE